MTSSNDKNATAEFRFADDGAVPNHPRFSLLVYRGALDVSFGDAAAAAEALFGANGWSGFWRNGVYPFHHYHSTCHEALAVARGWAAIRFGGEGGETVRLESGDIAVLPAGTGHRRIEASADLMVVGCYPPDQPYDLLRDDPAAHDAALERILATPMPATDPVFGTDGGLRRIWPRG